MAEWQRHIDSTRSFIDTHRYIRIDCGNQQNEVQMGIGDLARQMKQGTSSKMDLRQAMAQKRDDLVAVVNNAAVAAGEMATLTQLLRKLCGMKAAQERMGTPASCDTCAADIQLMELTACAPATTASLLILCPKCSKPWFS